MWDDVKFYMNDAELKSCDLMNSDEIWAKLNWMES